MNKKSLIRELERQFEESRQNFREGKCIPLEDFDWGFPQLDEKVAVVVNVFHQTQNYARLYYSHRELKIPSKTAISAKVREFQRKFN